MKQEIHHFGQKSTILQHGTSGRHPWQNDRAGEHESQRHVAESWGYTKETAAIQTTARFVTKLGEPWKSLVDR